MLILHVKKQRLKSLSFLPEMTRHAGQLCEAESPGRKASLLPLSIRKPSWRSVLESRDPVTHFETLSPVTSSVGSPSSGPEQVFPQRDSSAARPGKGGAPPISFSPPPPGVVVIWIRPLITGFILHWF